LLIQSQVCFKIRVTIVHVILSEAKNLLGD
jgi:hypothetical protein